MRKPRIRSKSSGLSRSSPQRIGFRRHTYKDGRSKLLPLVLNGTDTTKRIIFWMMHMATG